MAMFEDADPHNRGEITYEALRHQLEKHGGLLENLSIRLESSKILLLMKTIEIYCYFILYVIALIDGWCRYHKRL